MIFANEVTDHLTSLVRTADSKFKARKLQTVLIVSSNDPKTEKSLRDMIAREMIEHVRVAVEKAAGPGVFRVGPRDEEAALAFYSNHTCQFAHVYRQGELARSNGAADFFDFVERRLSGVQQRQTPFAPGDPFAPENKRSPK